MASESLILSHLMFRPKNCKRALEYLQTTSLIDLMRIKLGDKKLIKGVEIHA